MEFCRDFKLQMKVEHQKADNALCLGYCHLADIPQVERASFHLVAILGSDQPFFDQLYCGSGI